MSVPVQVSFIPMSKSIALRAMALKYSMGLETELEGHGSCKDLAEMERGIAILEYLPEGQEGKIEISEGAAPYRFLIALAASSPGKEVVIVPGKRLSERPIKPLIEVLHRIGADIQLLPEGGLRIRGRQLDGSKLEGIDTAMTTQFESALILASPLWLNPPQWPTPDPSAPSSPYRIMTRRMMEIMSRHPDHFEIENDWSAASPFFALKLILAKRGERRIADEILFMPLGKPEDSIQGDAKIHFLVEEALEKGRLEADMRLTPDLVPALAVGCALGGVPFRFDGVGNLRFKESDRIESLRSELAKMGYELKIEGEGLETTISCNAVGDSPGKVEIDSHGDHRIAMAFAIAEFAGWEVKIDNPKVVEKSYPAFWVEMKAFQYHLKNFDLK